MDLLNFIGGEGKDLEYLIDPSPNDAMKLITHRKGTHIVIIYGEIIAQYEGRAKSQLDELMPRLIITKPDGTFMIHEAEEYRPKLWNPPPAQLFVSTNMGILILRSIRLNPREVVQVEVPIIKFVAAFKIGSTINYRVFGREEDMVNMIVSNPNIIEDGLTVISREYHTLVGDIDVLAKDTNNNLVVIECKRSQAGPEAVNQLKRYVDYLREKEGGRVRGILVAPSISSAAYKYLRMYGLEFKRMEAKV